jgi:hypothetical protein
MTGPQDPPLWALPSRSMEVHGCATSHECSSRKDTALARPMPSSTAETWAKKRREEERDMVERHKWRPIGTSVTYFALPLLLPADRRTPCSIGEDAGVGSDTPRGA